MKNRSGEKVKLTSIDEMLGVLNEESAMEIEISRIHSFKDHPFKVLDDGKMQDLVDSVKENGVLTPVLIRPTANDQYEMISGHRRMHAAAIAGLTTIPAIIREMSDDEAVIAMVVWSNFPLIEQAHRRLADVVVENQDFQTLIRHYDRPVTFFYCDPPYHATEGYYQNIGEDGFTERDHIRLRDALLSMEGKFLLSYNDDAFIRGLYDAPGIQIEPVTRLNNIRQRYDPNCQFSELLIANYDMAERAHATTQINLFDFQKGEFDETYVF